MQVSLQLPFRTRAKFIGRSSATGWFAAVGVITTSGRRRSAVTK
jgi:hypothetical protein